jgi:hypothetical protein
MAIAYFPSLDEADTIDVVFVPPQGDTVNFRLLVDSGFTGKSSFVLSESETGLAHANVPAAEVVGALHGVQKRVVVMCRLEAIPIEIAAIAILADLASLALPTGVQGIVGLRFLRHFRRWGSERHTDKEWQFFLESDTTN